MGRLPDEFNSQCPVCTYLYNRYTEPDTSIGNDNETVNPRLADHLSRIGTPDDKHFSNKGTYTSNDVYAANVERANDLFRDPTYNEFRNHDNYPG